MIRIKLHSRWCLLLCASSGLLLQSGCVGFFQRELEALFAPSTFTNSLFVLDSVFFDVLAGWFY